MKKILIVEDASENMQVAKAFFSNIPGYEFVFATNRKQASEILPAVDAVITDRSLPYSEDSLLGCVIPANGHSNDTHPRYENNNAYIDQINGYHIMYRASCLGKPVVMISEHGDLNILLPVTTDKLPWLLDEEYKKVFSLEKLLDDVENEPKIEFFNYLAVYANDAVVWVRKESIKKTNSDAWRIAWEELQKQF